MNSISENWGIDSDFWTNYKFNLKKNRLWIVGEIENIPMDNFVCSGLLLSEKKLSGWKLFNNSVTFLNTNITKRLIELNEDQLRELYRNHELIVDGIDNGYYALTRKKKPLASVYVENEKMNIRLPHSFNLILD